MQRRHCTPRLCAAEDFPASMSDPPHRSIETNIFVVRTKWYISRPLLEFGAGGGATETNNGWRDPANNMHVCAGFVTRLASALRACFLELSCVQFHSKSFVLFEVWALTN